MRRDISKTRPIESAEKIVGAAGSDAAEEEEADVTEVGTGGREVMTLTGRVCSRIVPSISGNGAAALLTCNSAAHLPSAERSQARTVRSLPPDSRICVSGVSSTCRHFKKSAPALGIERRA